MSSNSEHITNLKDEQHTNKYTGERTHTQREMMKLPTGDWEGEISNVII